MKELKNIMVIGPVYPYKGGIAHYTGLLSKALSKKYHVDTISYKLQYPKIMFRKEQKDYGNKTFQIEDAKYLINTANPLNWQAVRREIRKNSPELLIVQWWHPYFAPCYQSILHGLKNTKILFVCHNVLPHERFPMDRMLTKNTLKRGNYCILHSLEDEENLKTLIPKMAFERTVLPTYQAFCLQHMSMESARQSLGIEQNAKVLLFFGLVRKYKGLGYLIAAAKKIVEQYEETKICVVGDFGSMREEYMEQIEKTGVKEHFIIRDGYVPDAEVEPYFAAANLNICPYETATQSAIVQVAFGFELPVLATKVGGLPEAVTDEVTGFIVEPKNPDAIAEGAIRYFKEAKENTFRENVRKEKERFSWDRTVEIIERLWKAEQECD